MAGRFCAAATARGVEYFCGHSHRHQLTAEVCRSRLEARLRRVLHLEAERLESRVLPNQPLPAVDAGDVRTLV